MVNNLSNPCIHKVDLKGIAFRTEIKIQNPTKNSMNITKPVVTLSSNGKYITSNSPEQKSIVIEPLTTTDDLTHFRKQHPKTAFIYIFHTTKEGNFRGKQDFAHDMDVIIEVENGVAKANGRFGMLWIIFPLKFRF